MTRLTVKTGVVFAALVVSFAITAIGQGIWGVMAIANVKLTPALPWSAIVMPVVLAGLGLFLAGRAWPRRGAAARRALAPFAPVSRPAWIWSLAAGVAGVVALAGLWTVLGSLARTAPNALPDTRGIPLWTAVPMLLVSIAAAPLTEEFAFRGYAMGLLRRHFGPISALVISSVMFALAHLTHGFYPTKLVVYLLVGLGLAATVWRTGSLLPAMVVHSFGDFVFFTLVWPHDAARRLVSEGGADASFYAALALTIVCGGLWYAAFRRLLRVTASATSADAVASRDPQSSLGATSHA
jgi:membrane protease YdiL (CAAX protease family)